MGAFYNSICTPGNRHREVKTALTRWLAGRGFRESRQAMLFDLDGEAERSAFVLWNEHWTFVLYSKYEEERRFIRELQNELSPLLYIWVQDSDVWGYDVFDATGFAGSFNSNPRTFQSFPDDPIDSGQRPAADPDRVSEWLQRPGQGADLRQIQRQRSLFKEDACLELYRFMGAPEAMLSYDDLERGGALMELAGWSCEQLLFFHPFFFY